MGTSDSEHQDTGAPDAQAATQGARLIDWTGERCVPWAPDYQMIYEHMHRYHFAASFCTGRRVLDLASGEGYGSAILGAVASEVVGVDLDRITVDHARLTYPADNVRFIEGSMLDADLFADRSFDVVVCFEALEHVREHDLLMQVILGALASDGLVVISTPDRSAYAGRRDPPNPYHVHELDRREFRELLSRHFTHSAMLTQEVAVGSVMQAISGGQFGEVIHLSGADGWAPGSAGQPPYLVALASRDPLPPVPSVSALVDTDLLLSARSPALVLLEAQLAERQDEVARLERQTARQDAQIERLEDSIRALAETVHATELAHTAAVAQLNGEVSFIKATRGWRALERMRPPYRLARRLSRPLRRLPMLRRLPR